MHSILLVSIKFWKSVLAVKPHYLFRFLHKEHIYIYLENKPDNIDAVANVVEEVSFIID